MNFGKPRPIFGARRMVINQIAPAHLADQSPILLQAYIFGLLLLRYLQPKSHLPGPKNTVDLLRLIAAPFPRLIGTSLRLILLRIRGQTGFGRLLADLVHQNPFEIELGHIRTLALPQIAGLRGQNLDVGLIVGHFHEKNVAP